MEGSQHFPVLQESVGERINWDKNKKKDKNKIRFEKLVVTGITRTEWIIQERLSIKEERNQRDII